MMSNARQYCGVKRSRLREIKFHADAIGVVEKELRIAGARHDAFAEFDVPGLQALADAIDAELGRMAEFLQLDNSAAVRLKRPRK